VILWGVFLRASKSGDGCGQHWLTCHGEVIPSAPELKNRHRIFAPHHERARRFYRHRVARLGDFALAARRKNGNRPPRHENGGGFVRFRDRRGLARRRISFNRQHGGKLNGGASFLGGGAFDHDADFIDFLTLTAWFASGGKAFNFKTESKVKTAFDTGVVGFL
jgi:hypothetical protein